MFRTTRNDGLQFGPLVSVHEAIRVAAPSENVLTLPHDPLLADGRAAEGSGDPQTGYFLGGRWSYEKHFDAPEVWERTRVAVEFEGVYRDATVYVNGAFAGQWANGYTGFIVDITPFLNFGESNTIRVDAQAGDDSRWYSGGGIYRPVHLIIGDLIRVAPQTLHRSSTPVSTCGVRSRSRPPGSKRRL